MVKRVVVVGGGVAGLTAARDLVTAGHDVVLLEGSDHVGGKLLRDEVGGVMVDVGAEAMLNRRPEGVALARAVGLELEHPTVASSRIWTRGALRPLPRSLMGVPLDLEQLTASGVLSAEGLERARREPGLPPEVVDGDVSVGDLVARRFGDEVVDRLVEPLLGGVYAGHARELSARASVPQLVAYAERGSLLEQGAAIPMTYDTPVFAGIPGGMGLLPAALAAGLVVRTGVTVRGLTRTPTGFEVLTGPTPDLETVCADAVVLATPAAPTARLLADLAPTASAELAGIESASMAVVTFAFSSAGVAAIDTGSSGFLVPPVDGRRIKASTFSFAKWGWVREAGAAAGLVHLRTSLGRHREAVALQASDEELVALSLVDLEAATGLRAVPVDTHVQRWGGGLPQYAVGHLDRVARIRADVALVPGLAVCGAAYDGVGIPAVIASAHRAAAELLGPDGTMET
ncbi:protoporphyrinogen oxidase [Nocardioides psychrotolerans]|uniref:Coproporphyrinogen III oxidase n=1 Tax=Nocardioides psychrotolerans TaxID=1005945 RepID=A0A1I3H6M9_9ACTN|nr:protoporphyrinogen oxidase [Nocardioides psychrotolerans]GEP37725.1 protoporphyrinogen oxidase [Nocardioides psychrotolerans]SFI31395.1 oxygen-dependent protoporphyrinogen oxidase [Nocardioides psychrotolerans]